jgi:hypothetical protein
MHQKYCNKKEHQPFFSIFFWNVSYKHHIKDLAINGDMLLKPINI